MGSFYQQKPLGLGHTGSIILRDVFDTNRLVLVNF